ncbi:DNA-3-methyladenine glycosylase [Rhizobiaceae bacterium n13]|uniref:DNA-3-methyladenine glycosylase II n=1 Tax=Ferirhizobium litorale TaxID=2927786 RepID=A0AAE3QGE1_9HYPH|nr:DNA-3-methyladenine glycosylase [Fererhizobium litorale]MDI7864346.1 DNA-3-methyladenine glycosylase [Fererhizobium litorale]MDI7924556.1 DNA-3-methyladenine glycosylase [Fererhizobium litorale]
MHLIRNEDDIAAGLVALFDRDPRLAAVAAVAGKVPLRLDQPGFAGLAHVIVSQMVSKASAEAIWRRIVAATGPLTAQAYLAADDGTGRSFGLSRGKADTLTRVAGAVACGELDLVALLDMPAAEAVARLVAIKGIGLWTAEVYLMFCGGHPDVFPAGDVALRAAVADALGLDARPEERRLREIASDWSPWRSVAARVFWAYYAARLRRDVTPIA